MTEVELRERIQHFNRWHYQLELQGQRTPIADPTRVNRHSQRRDYILPPLLQRFGGSLAGRRVLDLGCNAGFWALACLEHGCDYVLGIDGRAMHIEQANLVLEARAIDPLRYDFRCANLFDIMDDEIGHFDVVLCLGLLYHVSKPMTLLEWIARLNTQLLVIDTSLSQLPGSAFEVRREPLDDPRAACDYELVLTPTRDAVIDLAQAHGYRTEVLEPRFPDWTGAEDYQAGARRAFLCTKLCTKKP